MTQSLQWLNQLSAEDAEAEFLKCCGSKNWARQMTTARPFASFDRLAAEADRVWWSLSGQDWLEAFRAHPKIGEKKAASVQAEQAQSWSAKEQAGVSTASTDTIQALAKLNSAYEGRFGFIFIVCASGKSSREMLEILKTRMRNDPATELRIAAEEQRKIMFLRLEKLLNQ